MMLLSYRWKEALNTFIKYQVPVVELASVDPDDATGLEQVATIFEKINSSGTKLTVFDLLTARLYPHQIDLRKLWRSALNKNMHLKQLVGDEKSKEEIYAVYTLRAVALYRGHDAKGKKLVHLSPAGFTEDFCKMAAYMDKAIERLTSPGEGGMGAIRDKWIPYTTTIPVLAALLEAADKSNDPAKYTKINQWYWSSVFTERYAGTVESKSMQDYKEVVNWMHFDDAVPTVVNRARTDYKDLDVAAEKIKKTSLRGNSIFRGTLCLLALNGAKDFFFDDSIAFHELDVHHIFPEAFLRDAIPDLEKQTINSLANQTLIGSSTNRKISKKAPSEYLRELEQKHGDKLPELLRAHFINEQALSAMRSDDYINFLNFRSKSIVEKIQESIGIHEAS